ncbi:hypothetical protein [Motiliproteus sp.]|uniref:hypothetical protein n=1 Tax=Motiliproteus sp. TaxID=1898955 RepID=UPI003BAA1412
MKLRYLLLLPLGALISACSTTSNPITALPADALRCPEPRPVAGEPVICTRIYAPVCAVNRDGQWQHRPNACEACANPDNIAYLANRPTPESCPQ